MPDLDEFAMAKLAREMAMAVRSYKDIFRDFEIDETDYYEIEKNEFYQRAKAQFAIEWNSALSATDRVKVISASYLEQMLPVLGAKGTDNTTPVGDATEIAKLFSRNAGLGESKNDGKTTDDRFVITINLGADTDGKPVIETFDKSIAIDANDVGKVEPIAQNQANSAQNQAKSAQTVKSLPIPEEPSPLEGWEMT